MTLRPGDSFDRFAIRDLLPAGLATRAFAAFDTRDQRDVVLELVRDDASPDERAAFLARARRVAGVRHDAIAKVFEADEADGKAFAVCERIDAEPIADRTAIATPADKIATLARIASGLAALHRAGIVHGEVALDRAYLVAERTPKLVVPLGQEATSSDADDVRALARAAVALLLGRDAPGETAATLVEALLRGGTPRVAAQMLAHARTAAEPPSAAELADAFAKGAEYSQTGTAPLVRPFAAPSAPTSGAADGLAPLPPLVLSSAAAAPVASAPPRRPSMQELAQTAALRPGATPETGAHVGVALAVVLALAAVGLAVLAGVVMLRRPSVARVQAPAPSADEADRDDSPALDGSAPRGRVIVVTAQDGGAPPRHARVERPAASSRPIATGSPEPPPDFTDTPASSAHEDPASLAKPHKVTSVSVSDIEHDLDASNVRSVVAGLRPAIQRCFDEPHDLHWDTPPIEWSVYIALDGHVARTHVASIIAPVDQCVRQVLEAARFAPHVALSENARAPSVIKVLVDFQK